MLTPATLHPSPAIDSRAILPIRPWPRSGPAARDMTEPAGTMLSFARDAEIYVEGDAAGNLYRVVSGVVRVYKLLYDGRRQISAFHFPGDMFGFEGDEHRHFSAEAVVQSKLLVFKVSRVTPDGDGTGAMARELWTTALQSLTRMQEHMLLLGRRSAGERLAVFLLEMAGRRPGTSVIELPMPRHDIADYLGLTLETVSRMFAELKSLAAIDLPSARRVELLNPALLRRMSS